MLIDPKVEKPTRSMFGHAIRGELDDLATEIQASGDDAYRGSLGMCLIVAGYVAIDVSGMRWPSDTVIRRIANNAAGAETRLDLSESDYYNFLSRAALGFERLDDAFGSMQSAATLPILIAASLLFIFRPEGKEWWEYLDVIEDAANAAEGIDLSVFPALMLRVHRTFHMESSDSPDGS
jgi:hypothetical protein